MKEGRIFFKKNPWPEGHPIKSFRWDGFAREDQVCFEFDLETEKYYSEREIPDDESVTGSWNSPIVWGNYHACRMSGCFPVCSRKDYSLDYLNDLELRIDKPPYNKELEEYTFQIYLLGHDSVANHRILFKKKPNRNSFDIFWKGKIALTYTGNFEFEDAFEAEIKGVKAPIKRNL